MSSFPKPLPNATQTAIDNEVNLNVAAGQSFTALDISRAVRNRNATTVNEYHAELKVRVHEIYENGTMGPDYVRTMIDIPSQFTGRTNGAYLYHLNTVDPSSYDPTKVQPLAPEVIARVVAPPVVAQVPNAVAQVINATTPKVSTTKSSAPETRYVMTDGRFRIPVKAVKIAGFEPGDSVLVAVTTTPNGDKHVAVYGDTPPANVAVRLYTVDQYSNILLKLDSALGGAAYEVHASKGYILAVPK